FIHQFHRENLMHIVKTKISYLYVLAFTLLLGLAILLFIQVGAEASPQLSFPGQPGNSSIGTPCGDECQVDTTKTDRPGGRPKIRPGPGPVSP
ncbi:MAG: hypothetical protein AAF633_05035, partial [Chloroflexota bacterium]